MAAKTIKENVANHDRDKKSGIEPEEHAHMIRWPEVVRDPLHKSAVHEGFVKNVNDVRCEKGPEEYV